ncbi:hypothetical protein AUJ14_05645 [Candidatus Micrarchaeota archaeon CG1_02_55_22]|nr:MAG: hypothetical protein AUJ14_05645 [Candidatus Micrarchaeota archaeon CG1_02_55_22]
MSKRVLLIHGWGGSPKGGWCPWLKKHLELHGFNVESLEMPNPDNPLKEEWVDEITAAVGGEQDVVLVGHSLGCPAILRFLESGGRASACVLVAGFAEDLGIVEIRNFVFKPFDWIAIRSACTRFQVINSQDDPYVPTEQGRLLANKLSAGLRMVSKVKHISTREEAVRAGVLETILEVASE